MRLTVLCAVCLAWTQGLRGEPPSSSQPDAESGGAIVAIRCLRRVGTDTRDIARKDLGLASLLNAFELDRWTESGWKPCTEKERDRRLRFDIRGGGPDGALVGGAILGIGRWRIRSCLGALGEYDAAGEITVTPPMLGQGSHRAELLFTRAEPITVSVRVQTESGAAYTGRVVWDSKDGPFAVKLAQPDRFQYSFWCQDGVSPALHVHPGLQRLTLTAGGAIRPSASADFTAEELRRGAVLVVADAAPVAIAWEVYVRQHNGTDVRLRRDNGSRMLGLENSLSLKDSYQFPLNGCLLEDMETFSREGSSDSSRKPLLWDFQREMLVAVGLVQGRKYILPNTMGIAGVVFTVEHPENPIIYDGSGKQVVRMTLVPGGGPGIAWKVHIQDEMGKPLLGARAVLLSGGVGIADRAVVRGDRPVELWVDPTRKPKCQVECGEYYPATAEYDGNSSTVRLRRLPAIRLQCNLTGRSVIEYALFSCRGCIALKDNIGGADAPDRLVGYVPPGDYVLVVLRRDQPLESAETYFTSVSAVDVLAMRITDGDRTVKASFVGNSREHCQLKGRILAPGSGAFSVGQINGVMFRYPSAVVRAGNLAEVVCRDKVPPDYLIAREPLEGAKPDKKWKGADIVFRHQDEWTYILVTAPSAQTQPHTGRAAQ